MGKGSKRRPNSVSANKFSENWDRIFGVKGGDNERERKSDAGGRDKEELPVQKR